jgi:glutamyl-tRNA synthetase/glutamyl-Q tRNA(Asp) synthetase
VWPPWDPGRSIRAVERWNKLSGRARLRIKLGRDIALLITRFAPAPTGYLHLGHVVNALHVWGAAQAAGGRVILRIEDHDRQRSKPEFEAALLEDLAWLEFQAEGPPVRQRERDPIYRAALQSLIDQDLVYGCSCTRAQIDGERYGNTCRELGIPLTDDVGWRVVMAPGIEAFDDRMLGPQRQDPSAQCGDLLLRDRLGNWTYQFAATVDDYVQGITDVIRGRDLLSSTGRQIRLARLIGRVEPPRFAHHELVMKNATEKLSKSDGDTGVRDLRAAGWTPAQVLDQARRLGGLEKGV